jgi:Fe-S-cluster-containing dehydrogenase component
MESLSRRQFLKTAGAGAVAATVAGVAAAPVQASSAAPAENALGMLIDITRCTGCNSCTLACKEANGRPDPETVPVRLDSNAYSFVDEREIAVATYQRQSVFVKRQCMQCVHPACASACTVGALRKTPEGPVVYDSKKCIGCRYCQYACPFGVPTYDWNNPLGLIHKCQLCAERLAQGEMPACMAACPAGVIQFGQRQELLTRAHAQIASNPSRYVDHIYGEHEAGGTSVLYLAGVPFASLGLPELGSEPIARYAEPVMKATPVVAVTVASLAVGLNWLMKRRELRMAEVEVTEHKGGTSL